MEKTTRIYRNLISKLPNAKVLVIGDVMLDRFTYGDVMRISPEAPVPVLHVNHEENYLGGAGNVARNIASLLGEKPKGRVGLIGVIGDDKSAGIIKDNMNKYKISLNGIVTDKKRPTITKTRIVAATQQIVRIDEEEKGEHSQSVQSKIEEVFFSSIDNYNLVVISDYGKGLITKNLSKKIIDICNEKKKFVLVDPSIDHFSYYKNATLITPNLKEAIDGMEEKLSFYEFDPKKIQTLGEQIKKKLELKNLVITLGAHGMALFSDTIKYEDPYIIPTKAKSVFDVSGAGDTVISVLAMCMSVGFSFLDSASISNVAAGVVVGKRGTSTLNLDELYNAL